MATRAPRGTARPVLAAVLIDDDEGATPEAVRRSCRFAGEDVQLVVLDDRGDEPPGAGELEALCTRTGAAYHRSPRRMGAGRSFNLALALAMETGHEHLLLVRSHTVPPVHLVAALSRAVGADGSVASVTPWTDDGTWSSVVPAGGRTPGDPAFVDWVTAQLTIEHGDATCPAPGPGEACALLPTAVVARVGLFDPVFGDGGEHALDWSARAAALGYRCALAPSVFVSSRRWRRPPSAPRHVTEIRHRSAATPAPAPDALDRCRAESTKAVIRGAAARHGYRLEAGWFKSSGGGDLVVSVTPAGPCPVLSVEFGGFALEVALPPDDVVGAVLDLMGVPPTRVRVSEQGRFADDLATGSWGARPAVERLPYPGRI
jgi:hypothetical protein